MQKIPLYEVARRARRRLVDMHFHSGVGHIGGNLSELDALLVLFHQYLQADDQFILSKGHGAGGLYVALWSCGRLADTDLLSFHQDGTLLAGHPPANGIPDIPFATGSLGHGLSLAAGTALGLRLKRSAGNVVCLTSDGEWQEGSTWEALVFACHHRLTNLKVLIDQNGLQGFGTTSAVASMSRLQERLSGFDACVTLIDGHDHEAISVALRQTVDRPHLIVMQTVKGKGISFMEDRMEWHYLPLTEAQYHAACKELEAK
jgi:transketolase